MSTDLKNVLEVFPDVRVGFLKETRDLPLTIMPVRDASHAFLLSFIKVNRSKLVELLTQHGAILFRGFDVASAQEFEDVALLLEPNLSTDYLGTSPRNSVTTYTFTASEIPKFFPVPQHLEMSFLPSGPARIMFFCEKATTTGGETPLCSFARVAEDLDPDVRRRFETEGCMYYRNYTAPNETQLDPWKLKRWPEIFGTDQRSEVEAVCAKDDVKAHWGSGGQLRLTNVMPAFARHPTTGKLVWSNHSQVFHPSMALGEYRRIVKRTQSLFHWLLIVFLMGVGLFRRLFQKPEDQGMNCFYAKSGRPVPDEDMEKVRDAIWGNMNFFRWRRGDVTFIDNRQVSHGRMPYAEPRRILTAFG